MKQVNYPIPTGWKLAFRELQRRIYEQLNSPWTKLTVLVVLCALVTRNDFSFTISIDGASLFGNSGTSVFSQQAVGSTGMAKLTAFHAPEAPVKVWTDKQLKQLAYVQQYKDVALQEMDKHGIPASITLAQGLLESGTGKSSLATRNNNHFGIKCFSKKCKKGHCSNHSDDHHKDFFRTYQNPEESFRSHSNVLLKDRYRKLFSLPLTDYTNWARGLRKAGYATDPRYADKLIALIENLELHTYDK